MHEIRYDESRPGIHNFLVLYELFTGFDRSDIVAEFEGKSYADFKRELAEVILECLRPLQSRYRELIVDETYVESLPHEGASRVRPIAEKALAIVKE